MKKVMMSLVVVLGMVVGTSTDVMAGEATEAVVSGVTKVSDAVATTVSSTEVKQTIVAVGGTLEDVLQGMITSAISAKDFLVDEVPEVVDQLLMWKLVESIAMTLLGLLALVGTYMYWQLVIKHWEVLEQRNMEPLPIIMGIFGSIGALGMVIRLPNITWLQIWVAPKVYLIEYAAELIK